MSSTKYSSIPEFYDGKSVFVTGGTGFLGKVIVEKLLRSCEGIENVYLLVRPKKGKPASDRLSSFIKSPAFDLIKEKDPRILNKIVIIEGDVASKELGISKSNQELLCEKVSVIINSAATLNFHEPLKIAVFTNLRPLRELIRLSRKMRQLESFIHISTSFSNWFELDIEEKFYSTTYDPNVIIDLCESFPDETLDKIQPILLGKHVNTYTFTKALAENLALKEAQDLPFALVRPSVVGPALLEPKVGWVDSYAALIPFADSIQAGIFRSGHIAQKNILDVIPVDMTSNMIIALACKVANERETSPSIPKVYHSSSASSNPISFGEMYKFSIEVGKNYPPSYIAWMPQLRFHESKFADDIDRFITHRLFAYLMDSLLVIFGQKAKATQIYDQIVKNYEVVRFAHTQPINILSGNYKTIIDSMSKSDQNAFYFDPSVIEWKQYNQDICFGTRKYFWRETGDPFESTVGKKKLRVIKLMIFFMRALAVIGAYYGLKKTGKYVLSKL